MDGFKIWRYYFPSFQETNWTFIAYILKIIQSSREADVSFIEAHRKVRSQWINFPVLLLPQENVWKMPGTAKLIQKSIHNGGLSNFVAPRSILYSLLFHVLIALRTSTKFRSILLHLETSLFSFVIAYIIFFTRWGGNALNTLGFGWFHKHSH